MSKALSYAVLSACSGAALLSLSCAGPFSDRPREDLRAGLASEAARYTDPADQAAEVRLQAGAGAGELPFDDAKVAELEELGGPAAYRDAPLELGNDLLGEDQAFESITLDRAVSAAVAGNLQAASARLQPAVNREDLLAAEAVFDWVFLADFEWAVADQPQGVPVIGGVPVGVGANTSQTVGYTTGLRRPLTTGGQFRITQGQTYQDVTTPGVDIFPDPSNAAFLDIGFDQPLLRNFGTDVTLAEIYLARNASQDAALAYRQTLIEVVQRTENAYWDLLLALHELQIRQRLFEAGLAVRDQLAPRIEFDARLAEYADAVATTEQRRSDLISARNRLRRASDQLKAVVEAPELPLGGETLVLPADEASSEAIAFNLLEAVTTALQHRPDVERALLNVDNADIRVDLADDARLPQLDLSASAILRGLDTGAGQAYEQLVERNFVDYIIGLQFEQAIGNRAAEASYRARRLERVRALTDYRQTIQAVVLDVKTALRNVQTAYALIEQRRVARLAATESLRALEAREEIDGLTPTFLDLKLRRQESQAAAELAEVSALVGYVTALADLRAALGTTLDERGIDVVIPETDEILRGR